MSQRRNNRKEEGGLTTALKVVGGLAAVGGAAAALYVGWKGLEKVYEEQQQQTSSQSTRRKFYFSKECSICKDEFIEGPQEVLPCGHVFHSKCVKKWFGEKFVCPVCNFEIPANEVPGYCKEMKIKPNSSPTD